MATARQATEASEQEDHAVQNRRPRKGEAMPEEKNGNELLGLTERIVSAHVANNAISSADLPDLIKAVYAALQNVSTEAETPALPKPVVPIKRSVTPNYIVCLEDGRKMKMLKRHLRTAFNMTPKEYRVRWGLSDDYPMVAPNYAKARSEMAKKFGLGRKPGKVKPKGRGKGAAKK
jgi:predicted transcriptional regulator